MCLRRGNDTFSPTEIESNRAPLKEKPDLLSHFRELEPIQFPYIAAGDKDLTGIRLEKTDEKFQCHTLSNSASSYQAKCLARVDLETYHPEQIGSRTIWIRAEG